MWELDLVGYAWKELRPTGAVPSIRSSHTCAVVNEKLVVFGGYDGARCNDAYEYSFGACVFLFHDHHIIIGRHCRRIARAPSSSLPVVFDSPDTMKWKALSLTGRAPSLSEHSSVVYNDKLYLFGGASGANALSNELYELCLTTLSVRCVSTKGPKPSPRLGHCAGLFAANKMVRSLFALLRSSCWFCDALRRSAQAVFGGKGEHGELRDLHVLHLDTFLWSELPTRGHGRRSRFPGARSWLHGRRAHCCVA